MPSKKHKIMRLSFKQIRIEKYITPLASSILTNRSRVWPVNHFYHHSHFRKTNSHFRKADSHLQKKIPFLRSGCPFGASVALSPHTYQCKQSGNFASLLHVSPNCNISRPMDYFEFLSAYFNVYDLHLIQGSYGSWKTWKILEFYCGIFQDWKVLKKG